MWNFGKEHCLGHDIPRESHHHIPCCGLLDHGCSGYCFSFRPYSLLFVVYNKSFVTGPIISCQLFQKSWIILLRPLSSEQLTPNSLQLSDFQLKQSHFHETWDTAPHLHITGLAEDRSKICIWEGISGSIFILTDTSSWTFHNFFLLLIQPEPFVTYDDRSHLAQQTSLYLYIFWPMRHNLVNKSFFLSFWTIYSYNTSGNSDWWFSVKNAFQCLILDIS